MAPLLRERVGMLDNAELVGISKFQSFVLRHQPEAIGLQADHEGWGHVDELIACAWRHGRRLSRAMIKHVVASDSRKRYALSQDGAKIRAVQEHSVSVDLGLEPRQPPETLFRGTTRRFLRSIHADGLRSGSRRHVHLSPDEETAKKVGQRRGKPVVLRIPSGDMWRAGLLFCLSENGVWLTEAVPPEYAAESV